MFKMLLVRLNLLLCLLMVNFTESANIFGIFYYPSYSHQVVFQSLVNELSERGHHLTILTADRMNSNHPNITEIHLNNSYDENINFVSSHYSFDLGGSRKTWEIMRAQERRMDKQLQLPEVQDLIHNRSRYNFDLIILEYTFMSPFLAFAGVYNCPVIGFSAIELGIPAHDLMGNHVTELLHPEITFPYIHCQLTFFQRLTTFLYSAILKIILPFHKYFIQNQINNNFGNFSKPLDELAENISLMFVNTNPVLGYNRPITPATIQLGFMHVFPPKPIDPELKAFLDSSINGAIYMSLGSNVKSKDLESDIQNMFLRVFSTLPYDVLWKYEDENLVNKSDNIKVSRWYPQSDLLAHPNVKLFITQGGLMSLEEAIDRETPIVAIPFLLDQYRNAQKAQEEGFGIRLDVKHLNETSLRAAIIKAMEPSFLENIKRFKKTVYDAPWSSREKAAWWTEYVIRHKDRTFKKDINTSIPFYYRWGLDTIATIFCIIFSIAKIGSYVKTLIQ